MASTAALFDRQQLQSRQDMLMLGQILNDVMQDFIEKKGSTYGPESIEKMEASTVEVFRMVKQFVGYNENEEEGIPEGSPLLAPLSPPPFDPDVAKLEEEVQQASERVQKIRVDMQKAIEEKVKKNILEKLPAMDEEDTEAPVPDEIPGGMNIDAEALKDTLANAAAKMPGLKAKLEDVYGRMYKIIGSSMDDDATRMGPPNTAERALKRLYDEPQRLDATEDLSTRIQTNS